MREYKFPTILKKTLIDKDVTVKALTKETGFKNAQISNYIHDKNTPSAKGLLILADYLGVSTDYLLTGGKPIDQGDWIYRANKQQCNRCLREYTLAPYNYCPYCGARMGGKTA